MVINNLQFWQQFGSKFGLPMKNGKPVIRCSSLDTIISCPGSLILAHTLGTVRESKEDSWEGSWCHYESARRLVEIHGAIPPEGGLDRPDIPADYLPSSFAGWMVDFYVAHCLEDAGSENAIEVECELLHEFEFFWLSGHSDFNAINADCTELWFNDLKTCVNVVDAAGENWQVLGYLVLFLLQWPTIKRAHGRIIQPRMKEEVGPRVTGITVDENGSVDHEGEFISDVPLHDLPAFLEGKVMEALSNPYLVRSGFKQCRWCDAWLKCPAIKEEIQTMKEVLLTDDLLTQLKTKDNDQALAEVIVARKLLSSKFNSAAELIKSRLEVVTKIITESGIEMFLIDSQGNRKINDTETAWEILAEALPAEYAYQCIGVNIGEVEGVLAKAFKIPKKTTKADKMDAAKKFEALLGPLVKRDPTKTLIIKGL